MRKDINDSWLIRGHIRRPTKTSCNLTQEMTPHNTSYTTQPGQLTRLACMQTIARGLGEDSFATRPRFEHLPSRCQLVLLAQKLPPLSCVRMCVCRGGCKLQLAIDSGHDLLNSTNLDLAKDMHVRAMCPLFPRRAERHLRKVSPTCPTLSRESTCHNRASEGRDLYWIEHMSRAAFWPSIRNGRTTPQSGVWGLLELGPNVSQVRVSVHDARNINVQH